MDAERPRWLYIGLWWILAGAAADLGLTLWGLRLGIIQEANPLMAPVLASRPALAAGLKMGVTGGAVLLFHAIYPQRTRLVGAAVVAVGLSLLAVLVLHIGWLRIAY